LKVNLAFSVRVAECITSPKEGIERTIEINLLDGGYLPSPKEGIESYKL